MNIQKLEQMLASKWDEIDDRWYKGTSKGFYYQEWDECLKRHGAVSNSLIWGVVSMGQERSRHAPLV